MFMIQIELTPVRINPVVNTPFRVLVLVIVAIIVVIIVINGS